MPPIFNHTLSASAVATALLQQHFTVQQGQYSFFFLSDCKKYNLPSCFALNADSPYGMTLLPPAPHETEYQGCVTKSKRCGNGCNPSNNPALQTSVCIHQLPMQWRLNPDEAVVLIGRSPPPTKYWSITSYLMSRHYTGSSKTTSGNFTSWVQKAAVSCPAHGPARCQNFASLDQPFNYLEGGFSQPFALVMTASKTTYQTVVDAIRATSPTVKIIHRVPLPVDVLNLGTDTDEKDMLTMLLRVAYPHNTTEMMAYYKNTPISVLRTTPTRAKKEHIDAMYYHRTDLDFTSRVTGVNERGNTSTVTHDELLEDMELLLDGIRRHHGVGSDGSDGSDNGSGHLRSTLTADQYNFMRPFFNTGLDCIDQGTECNGDSADTLYPISANIYHAQGCQTIPVLTIGVALTLVLWAVFLCVGYMCFKKKKKDTTTFNKLFEHKQPAVASMNVAVSTNTKGAAPRSCVLAFVVGSLCVASLMCMVPAVYLYAERCQWGHSATIDSGPKDVFIVYGVNHAATGHSEYASITAYRYSKLSGLVSKSSEDGYLGSANMYLPGGAKHRSSPYLFAYAFARDCSSYHQHHNGEDRLFCYDVPFDKLPLGEYIFWIERMYVNPTSKTGPASNETIMARVVHVWE